MSQPTTDNRPLLQIVFDALERWWKRLGRRRWLVAVLLGGFTFLTVDAVYLAALWPEWNLYSRGAIPESRVIASYRARARTTKRLPPLQWTPVSGAAIPQHLRRIFILAEDSRFSQHGGIDWRATFEAFVHNLGGGQRLHGGSTISQQTAKNLFLSSERSLLRKWHELFLTLGLERNLTKQRIMTLYANIVELGPGIYGVEAAARAYWKTSASALTQKQSIELAASLPSPRRHNPKTRTETFVRRTELIRQHLDAFGL